jgi:N utilization substance protein A
MLEPDEEIRLEEARDIDPEIQLGDEVGVRVAVDFGRVDAQSAKQVIFQKVRDAEREIVYNEFAPRKGEIVSGIARRVERGNIVVDLGRTEALLPRREIIPGEQFKPGNKIEAYLSDVALSTRGPQIYLSRACKEYVVKLFEREVPEMRDGTIEIKIAAREAGARTKIGVVSNDRDVDPVGACVGQKGMRVQNVIRELKGEKIDIIPFTDNAVVFAQRALSPAEISSINVDEHNKTMEVIVEDAQLALAIGRKGQNVRLATQLLQNLGGWKLDILSKSKLTQRTQQATFNLQNIDGVSETLAHSLYQAGFLNVRQVAEATLDAVQKVAGYEEAAAAEGLITRAKAVIAKSGDLLSGPKAEDFKPETPEHDPEAPAEPAGTSAE